MNQDKYTQNANQYLRTLCSVKPDRCVGSPGNLQALDFFENTLAGLNWLVSRQEFSAIDWEGGGALCSVDGSEFDVLVSPYSLGCDVTAELICVSSIPQLEQADLTGKIVLLHGEIAREQIMPKNFVFYNPEEHQKIISLLESGQPKAIISATGRNSATAGGVYPFPLIEDGDFDIPSVYMTDVSGNRLLQFNGNSTHLKSVSRRISSSGYNVIGRLGNPNHPRIVVTAHIDAKKGTPGAMDNASGVVVLLLLAELLSGYAGENLVEIVAFNGEDYYAVPGQMLYLQENRDHLSDIFLDINIDGAGYREGKTAFSFYGTPDSITSIFMDSLRLFDDLVEGAQWVQGDHSIFVQSGRPAVAVTSQWFTDHMESQDITHTPKDHPDIVDCRKLVEIARALNWSIRSL